MKKIILISMVFGLLLFGASIYARSGAEVVKTNCMACHSKATAKALNAPAVGIKKDWVARIAKGKKALYKVAIKGSKKNPVMSARGGCIICTDKELRAAVDYMISQSK